MHQLLVQWVGYVVPWIEVLGIVLVLWSVLEALAGLAQRGWSLLTRRATRSDLSAIRVAMGEKMVLGLEFFLAGDIVQTIVVPTWESLAILGGIVVIRTVLVYFLNAELRQGGKPGSA
ncbi:MAG: DUF1622 domain-containing protein [Pseudomonadota bacterium]